MKRTFFSTWACILSTLGLALGAACGGSGSETSGGGAANASSSGTGGTGGSSSSAGGTGSGTAACNGGCAAPQVCGASGVCIDPGTCAGDADCTIGTICDVEAKACVPGGGCGSQEAKVEAIPPNLLIVLDRSCSMTQAVGDTNKWIIAVGAINKMTTDFNSKIRFGLTMFPDLVETACAQDQIPIPVAPGNEKLIQEMLTASLDAADQYYPDGPCQTNIDTAMKQATTEPALADMDRDSYVLLLTDGKQSQGCDPNGNADQKTTNTITNLLAMQGVPTFVLGFGDGVDPAQMDKFAVAGGVPSDGAHKYYDASDQASLDKALNTIAQKTLSCVYTLDTVPANSDEIFVFFNNDAKPIPRDATHADGWDYDPAKNQVEFFGPSCENLKSGAVTDLDIVLGCPAPTPN